MNYYLIEKILKKFEEEKFEIDSQLENKHQIFIKDNGTKFYINIFGTKDREIPENELIDKLRQINKVSKKEINIKSFLKDLNK